MGWLDRLRPPRRYLFWCGMIAAGSAWLALRFPLPVGIGLGIAAVGIVAVCVRWAKPLAALALTAVLFLGLGAGYRYVYRETAALLVGETDTVTGVIREKRSGRWYVLRVTRSQRLRPGSRVRLYCPDAAAPELYDTVTATVRYGALSERGDTDRADRILLTAMPTAYGEDALTVDCSADSGPGWALAAVRQSLSRRLRTLLPGQEGAVLAAMCLGDRQYLSEETVAAFRSCGLPHILVVSGLHLSVIIGAVYGLLRRLRLPSRLTVLLTAAAMLLYSGLVGFSASVCRAGGMALVLLAGRWVRRPADGLNSMGLALCGILLSNPYALYDVGLQLSFSAVAGILAFTPRLTECTASPVRAHPCLRPLQAGLCTTLGASLLLSPFLAGYFGELSWVSPLANLVAVPAAGGLLLLGCLTTVCLAIPPLGWLGRGCGYLAGWLTRVLLGLCRLLDAWTSTVTVPSGSLRFWWLTVSCGVLAVLLYVRPQWVGRAAGVALAAFLLLFLSETLAAGRGYTVTVVPAGEAAAVQIQKGSRCLLLVQDGSACPAAQALYGRQNSDGGTILAVNGGSTADAASVLSLRQTAGAATLLCGDTADWALGLEIDRHTLAAGQPAELWPGLRLTRLEGGWWRVQMEDTSLLVSPTAADFDAQKIPEKSADGVVFSGEIVYNDCWTAAPQSVWVCTAAQRQTAALPRQPAATASDAPLRLYTRGRGDWRRSP